MRKIRHLRGDKVPVNSYSVRKNEGKLSATKSEYLQFWKKHFENRYELPDHLSSSTVEADIVNRLHVLASFNYYSICMDSSFTKADFNYALKKLRRSAACGIDGVKPGYVLDSLDTLKNYIFESLKKSFNTYDI